MFLTQQPTTEFVNRRLANLEGQPAAKFDFRTVEGVRAVKVPTGFVLDQTAVTLGVGQDIFDRAKALFVHWEFFSLGWVDVGDSRLPIEEARLVAVIVHSIGLWSVNISRIRHEINTPTRFGFVYQTTSHHVEFGEERFLLEMDPLTDKVSYSLLAVSRPASRLAQLGYPVTRYFQKKFARESTARMKQLVHTKIEPSY